MWRAAVAVGHYRASLAVIDDPSIRELEQAGAFIEGGFALLLLFHGAALLVLSRRAVKIHWPYTVSVAIAVAVILGATLLGAPIVSLPGAYPILVVGCVFLLSHFLPFGWVSLYLGVAPGGVAAWLLAAPDTNTLACLAVVVPAMALAFGGAGLKLLVGRVVALTA